jgi:hypothetical protein
VLSDVVKLCFAGEPFIPPPSAQPLLELLFSADHALCHINIKGRKFYMCKHGPVGYVRDSNLTFRYFLTCFMLRKLPSLHV